MRDDSSPPDYATDDRDPARLVLRGRWTLKHAIVIGERLRAAPPGLTSVDASAVDRLDSAGVLQLLRFARRNGLEFSAFEFRDAVDRLSVERIDHVAADQASLL